jgi:hypothetical protein
MEIVYCINQHVRVKALTVLDAHSIHIKRTWERRINERAWKRHNAYGRRSISCIIELYKTTN